MIEAVLLDWGHTLFDTAGSVEFMVEWSTARGRQLAAADIRRAWDTARRRSRTAEELAKGRDKDSAVHRECWLALWAELDAMCPGLSAALYEHETTAAGWSPYIDTPDLLQALHDRGVPAVVVSDVPFDLRPIFAHYGLGDLIHTFVLSGEHATVKSELRLFGIALAAVGVAAHNVLMVGDNPLNDGAAIDAGIPTLLLPTVAHGQPRGLRAVVDLVDGSLRP